MSHAATAWAMTAKCDSPTEKAILFVVAEYVGQDGACYPSHKTISARSCASVRSVVRTLAAFEERGWIVRRERRRSDGSRTSDLIIWTATDNPEPCETHDATVSPCATKVPPSPSLSATVSHLTTFEPATEPVSSINVQKPQNRFDEFWAIFPHKVAKAAAKKAYQKALKEIDHETLVRILAEHVRAGVWSSNFKVHAASWLNGERWTDDIEAIRSPRMAGATQAKGSRREDNSFAGIFSRRRSEDSMGGEVSAGRGVLSGSDQGWDDGVIEGQSGGSYFED